MAFVIFRTLVWTWSLFFVLCVGRRVGSQWNHAELRTKSHSPITNQSEAFGLRSASKTQTYGDDHTLVTSNTHFWIPKRRLLVVCTRPLLVQQILTTSTRTTALRITINQSLTSWVDTAAAACTTFFYPAVTHHTPGACLKCASWSAIICVIIHQR